MDEQLYEILAKRAKDNDTLVITEQHDEIVERKYRKYQQAYVMIMVVPQQLHYVSKLTTRPKINGMQASSFEEEGLAERKKEQGSVRAPSINQTPYLK